MTKQLIKGMLMVITPCEGIRIPESKKILLAEPGIVGFGIQNTAQGIQNPANDWIQNPSSADKDWKPVAGIRSLGLWNPEYSSRNPESH